MPGTVTLHGPEPDNIAIVEDGSASHKTFLDLGWKPPTASRKPSNRDELESGTPPPSKARGGR